METDSRCGIVGHDVDQHGGHVLLVLLGWILLVLSLLQLGQRDHCLHAHDSLLVTHALEKGVLELLIRVVAAVEPEKGSASGADGAVAASWWSLLDLSERVDHQRDELDAAEASYFVLGEETFEEESEELRH
jgi:hypothetical protein